MQDEKTLMQLKRGLQHSGDHKQKPERLGGKVFCWFCLMHFVITDSTAKKVFEHV